MGMADILGGPLVGQKLEIDVFGDPILFEEDLFGAVEEVEEVFRRKAQGPEQDGHGKFPPPVDPYI
jgi:hypothetical protein